MYLLLSDTLLRAWDSVQERKDHVLQKLVLGTHTAEAEQNYLMVRPAVPVVRMW